VGSESGGTKKRYALIDEDGNMEIKGFEYVRGDWSEIAKETQEKILEYILKGREDKVLEFIRNVIKEVMLNKISKNKLIITRQLTKNLKNYTQIAPHVKVAKDIEKLGIKVSRGMPIRYIITKDGKTISDKARWYEYAKNYDEYYYINNQIIPSALRILSVLGYTKSDLLNEQKSLDKF
ncbi:MAG: DNA polymerase, partial [Candidatus Aenigmarchaeota archaeon ex4484_56]